MEEENDKTPETDVAPALISVHPTEKFVSVAVGSELRVFNIQENSVVTLPDESGGHNDSIRAIRFSSNGQLFVSAGDDKLVKIWATDSWHCICSVVSEKRVSAVSISNDGQFVCFADKFGVVYVVDMKDHIGEDGVRVNKNGIPILSHYCSIITRLEFSPDGRFIISADRDYKIRVTVFPKNPLNGAHEIQSFCLGHTEFVSCLAFVACQDSPQGLLVSGSGDSTVRLWDHTSGSLLDTCNVGDQAELHSNGKDEEILAAVTDLCTTPDGSLVAVAIQSLPGVMLLRCNLSTKTLSIAKVVSVEGETFIPTGISSASSSPLLWMVMGASTIQASNSPSLARVRAISGFCTSTSESSTNKTSVLEDTEMPGGELLLQTLQGKLSIGEEAFLTAAEAVKTSMRNLLIKKQYSAERREFRKRGRNDVKTKQ